MKVVQRVLAGLAVVATLGAASGCGASGEPSSPAKSPAGPQQVLLDSVEALTAGGNFGFTVTGGSIGVTGTVDVPSKSAYVAVETRGKPDGWPAFRLRTVDRERWIRVDVQPGVPTPSADAATGSYVRIDLDKVADGSILRETAVDFDDVDSIDPLGSAAIFGALVSVEATGKDAYAGKVDLTRATAAAIVGPKLVSALGEKTRAVPFRATLDDKGRLFRLTIDVPGADGEPASSITMSYEFGIADPTERVAAAQEAPDSVYQLVSGVAG